MPILEGLLDLLYPPKCPFCGVLLEKGALLCPDCQRDLPWLTGGQAEKAVELTAGCVAPLRYQEKVRAAVLDYKFHDKPGRCRAFGALVAQCVADHELDFDLITWAPLSAPRRRERGYDQAELLAREVGKRLGKPVAGLLTKKEVPAQSGLEDEAARRANVLGAYALKAGSDVRGKRILLIDDVVTTGATLSECAKVLRVAGADSVACAALARAR